MRLSLVVLCGALTISGPCLAATTYPVNSVAGFVRPESSSTALSVVAAVRDKGTLTPRSPAGPPTDTLSITTISTTNGPFNTAPLGSTVFGDDLAYAVFGQWFNTTGTFPAKSDAYGQVAAGVPTGAVPRTGTRTYKGDAFADEITQSSAGYLPVVQLNGRSTFPATVATVNFGTRTVSVTITLPPFLAHGGNLVLHGKGTLAKKANGTTANNGTMPLTGTAISPTGDTLTFSGRSASVANGREGLFGPGAADLAGTFFVMTHRSGQDNYLVAGCFGGARQ